MASHLFVLFRKEVRVIFRDPTVLIGTILIPLVLFPLMGSAIHVSEQAAEKQLAEAQVAFLSFDAADGNGTLGAAFFRLLAATNVSVQNATATSTEAAVNWTVERKIDTLVVLPVNFTEAIASGHRATVSIYQVLTTFGPSERGGSARVEAVVAAFNQAVAAQRAAAGLPNATAAEALYPARAETLSIIHGTARNVRPDTVINTVLGGSIMLPLVVSIMIVMSAQLAATSVAAEKEQKTLEVLLTLPTRRENILFGKLLGVFVVSIVGTLTAVVGFSSYAGSITSSLQTTDAAEAGLIPQPEGYAFLLVALMLAFVASLALAVLVASYAKDIYGAQSLMSVVYLPVFLPSIVLMVSPVEILPAPVQAVIYAVPFSYPSLAGKALYTHDYAALYLGVAWQLIFVAIVLYLAARMFSTEKVLTARLSFGKRKKRAPKEG